MPSCTYCITRSCLLSITLRTDESRDSPCNSLQEPGDQRFHAAKPTKDRYELEGDGPVIPHCYWSQEIMVTVVVRVRRLFLAKRLRFLSLDIVRTHVGAPTAKG